MDSAVAIVGAGGAGAAAAARLAEEPVEVTIFEKSSGLGGRAATRRHRGCHYEYGANYLTDDDGRVSELVTETLSADGLVDIEGPVWVFDADGEIRSGRNDDRRKWTYETGITQLAKRLIGNSGATVHRETRVETLARTDDGWLLRDADGDGRGTYDAVVLTPPAPQTADLLGQTKWDHGDRRNLRTAIESVPYRTIIAGLLHYDFEIEAPYYALVNEDRDHDIGWIGREECKPGHVPEGETLLLVQMAPEWSVDHYETPAAETLDGITTATAELLGDDRLLEPDWTDHQHWRYALPDAGVDKQVVSTALDHDLALAGDWVPGEARLHAAVRSGLEAGDALRQRL